MLGCGFFFQLLSRQSDKPYQFDAVKMYTLHCGVIKCTLSIKNVQFHSISELEIFFPFCKMVKLVFHSINYQNSITAAAAANAPDNVCISAD